MCSLRKEERYEIVIIDDNSPDGTQDVVKQLIEHFGEKHIVSLH